ncbi:hypothetical protein C5D18_14595 [Rathayibacter tritici]|nr:hypothetical protein C5D18_14595 [Rathayibacter tritici]
MTVTLKDGYTFANGTTTYSGTTDANGLITLPDIKVPSKGGDSTFAAKSDTLTTSAPVSSTATAKTGIYSYNTSTKAAAGPIKESSTATSIETAGLNYVSQNKDGSLRYADGNVVPGTESGVIVGADLVATRIESGAAVFYYKRSDGIYSYNNTTKETSGPIPDSSTATSIKAVGTNFVYQNEDGSIRTSDGKIISGTDKDMVVGADLVAIRVEGGSAIVYYKKTDGIYAYDTTTKQTSGPLGDPNTPTSDSKNAKSITVVGENLVYQNEDGSLWFRDGSPVPNTDKNVVVGADLVTIRVVDNEAIVYYKKADGIYQYNTTTKVTSGPIDNSKTAKSMITDGTNFAFQNEDGTIRFSDGKIIPGTETNVEVGADLYAYRTEDSAAVLYYKKSPACA